jgi:hypothetical protein
MYGHRQQQFRRDPRRCVFCGQGGTRTNRMSEEHLWPEWMHPYLPVNPEYGKHEIFGSVSRRIFRAVRRKPQMGQMFTLRIKHVVCSKCNNTWMGQIEENTKPVLIPLVQGTPITLTIENQKLLAIWLTLKMIIIERARPRDAVIPLDDLVIFMKSNTIPSSVKLWVLYHDVEDWYTALYTESNLMTTVTQPPPIAGDIKNVQVTALGIGHLFVFAWITTNPEIQFEPELFKRFGFAKRIWPIEQKNITWPLRCIPPPAPTMLALSLQIFNNAPFTARGTLPEDRR